ncbi:MULTISPECIES: cytochrome P450 [unclassified Mycobacterium]|uniref:cytochrome P450 n=1 Tax=unclassified Mycobacterium TaxID=2642494 RepID=UPI0029C65592|nr:MULTISPECIES: cytochrome P450 [unclassified Mycobacterium]
MTQNEAAPAARKPPAPFSTLDTTPEKARASLREARAQCPVAHNSQGPEFYTPLRYADVKKAAQDWRTFQSSPSIMRPVPNRPKAPPIEFDPPEHTAWRKIFHQAANPATARRIEPLVQADARELIDRFAARGHCELIEELAEPLPLRALCHVLGLNRDKAQQVRQMTVELNTSYGDEARVAAAFARFAEFGAAEVARRRDEPRDDMLTALSEMRIDDEPLTVEQIGQFMVSFLSAGHSSTVAGLGQVIRDVLADQKLRDRVTADPTLIPLAVEESLRLSPPFFGFFRQVATDTEVSGVSLEAGESVFLCWAAANLDPEAFPEPDRFDIDRKAARILTFGFGIHACPGAPMARMELSVTLAELLRRLPDIELVDPDAIRYDFEAAGTRVAMRDLRARFTPSTGT